MPAVSEQNQGEIAALCRRYGVRRLDLFGSSASGRTAAASDVDFLVDFDDERPQGAADRYFGLLEGLRAVTGRSVDLVVRKAVRNPYFLSSAERQSRTLYAA